MLKITNSTALWAVLIALNTIFIMNNIVTENHGFAAMNFIAGVASWLCYFRAVESKKSEDKNGS